MSIQRQRANSSRFKQVLVKVNQISKRLPQDFFLSKTISASPRKRQLDFNQKQVINWYERDDSAEKNKYKIHSRLVRRNDPARLSKLIQPIQPLQISNENQICFNRLLQSSNHKQKIILKAIKQTKKQPEIKVVTAVTTNNQPQKQSGERIVKSQNKRHRRFQSPFISRTSVIKSARMSLRQIKGQPSRYDNMNVGFDGFLTFNRFS